MDIFKLGGTPMLNRNAARHLLLVASILLCAFIYAGYSLATRGDDAPADQAEAAASGGAGGLRPAPSDAATGIPAADGDALSLAPPAPQSMRPLSPPPPAAASDDPDAINGLVPDAEVGTGGDTSSGSPMMPGTTLPLPGFGDAPAGGAVEEPRSAPVLALPGMDAQPAGGGEDFGDEDFGAFVEGAPAGASTDSGVADEDFAALPGFEESPAETSAPVLPPPPGTGNASAAGLPPLTAPETGTALRPPPRPAPAADAPGAFTPPPPAARPVVSPPPPPVRPAQTGANTPPPPSRPASDPAPSAPDDPAPRSDSLRIYVVAQGDTLSSIAMRELGSGFLADNIFLLNRDVIDDPNHLMAGVKIRLPYANPGAAGEDPSSASGYGDGTAAGRRPTQGLGSTHIVVRGDTLSSIAQQYYGSSAAWRFLYEANKTVVPNPNQLSVGMELNIPPYEE